MINRDRSHLRPQIPLRACFVRLHRLTPAYSTSESTTHTISSIVNTFRSRLRRIEDPDLFFTHVNEEDFITTQIEHAKRILQRETPATPSTQSLSSIGSRKVKKKRPFWNNSIDISKKRVMTNKPTLSTRSTRSSRSSRSGRGRDSIIGRKRKKSSKKSVRKKRRSSNESRDEVVNEDLENENLSSRRSTGPSKENPLFKKIIPLTKRPETRKRMALDLEIANATTKRSIPLRVFVHPDDSHNLIFQAQNQSPIPSRRNSNRPSTAQGRRRVDMSEDMVNIGEPTTSSRRSSVSNSTSLSQRSQRRTPALRSSRRSSRPKSSQGKMISRKARNTPSSRANRSKNMRNSQNQPIHRPGSLTLEDLDDDDDMLSTENLHRPYFNVEVGKRNNSMGSGANVNEISSLLLESSGIVQKLQRALINEQEKNQSLMASRSTKFSANKSRSGRVRKSGNLIKSRKKGRRRKR